MADCAADMGDGAGDVGDGAADMSDGNDFGVVGGELGDGAADKGDGAADKGDGAADMGDGAADMGDVSTGSIPVFVDVGISVGTRGGLGRGGPSSDDLASDAADVGVGFVVNSCIPANEFWPVARLPESSKGSWVPPSPNAAGVLCLRFLNQIKPTTTATATGTATIAIETLFVILSSPERGPGCGPALGFGSGPALVFGRGPGRGPTLDVGPALGLGLGLTLGLVVGPEYSKQV